MKHRYCLGLSSLLFLLILSTSGTYAITESFDITATPGTGFLSSVGIYEIDFIEKDHAFVEMTVEVLETELGNCSIFVVDNYQRDQLYAIWDYVSAHQVYPWAEPLPPGGTHGPTGLAYADLEPVEVYFGGNNLTLDSERTITGYLGPQSQNVTSTTVLYPNITSVSTEYRQYDYFIILESMTSVTTYNPENPLYPRILAVSFYYARVHVKFVSTLPAPTALITMVILSSISLIIYKRKKNKSS